MAASPTRFHTHARSLGDPRSLAVHLPPSPPSPSPLSLSLISGHGRPPPGPVLPRACASTAALIALTGDDSRPDHEPAAACHERRP